MLLKGAGGRDREEIEETVDSLGANLDAAAGHTSIVVDGDTLTRNLPQLAGLLSDVVLRPTFVADELERLKRETISDIEGLRDDDEGLASRFFRSQVYAGHAYGRPASGTVESVKGISIDDVQAFYRRHFVGANLVISAAGDLTSEAFQELLEDRFSDLPRGEATGPKVGPAPRSKGRRVQLVDKPQRTQAQILIGHDGIAATNPDRPALTVLNTAFGGTFTARLMQEIRVEQGWSYGAYSRLGADRDAGSLHMWIFPEIDNARAATERTIELFAAVAKEGLTDAEVAFAKDYLVGGLAFIHETPNRLLDELVRMEVLGLPRDHLDTWVGQIRAVTPDDVRRVAKERLRPDDLVITVLATAKDLKADLARMPGVTEVTVTPYDSE
jgi:zinc protease